MHLNSKMLGKAQDCDIRKLIVIPCYMNTLGGMTVSLALLIKGFQILGLEDRIRVLVRADTLMEKYLTEAGLSNCLEILKVAPPSFFQPALDWVNQQPTNWPLLLDNSVWRERLPLLVKASIPLRFSKRSVYHFCHDLAISKNVLGFLARKITFACLSPRVICNSQFTASYVRSIMPDIRGVLYQPVDFNKYRQRIAADIPPPDDLRPLLESGARIMLTPSRLNEPGIINDKNLRALLPVLAALKAEGHFYHGVVIGEDPSPGKKYTQDLLRQAQELGVNERFTILTPTFRIEDYYKYADIVVTLAPREPFGRTVVEAIACGVPVVGSATGGIHEILQNFAPNWVVNPNEPKLIANKIIEILENPETQTVLTKGQNWIFRNCSISSYAMGMMKITGLIPDIQESLEI